MTTAVAPTPDKIRQLFDELSNWGRWGADDERGALNLITPEKRAQAMGLARDGVVVSCALPLPVSPAPDNPTPVQHFMTGAGDIAGQAGPLAATGDYFAIAPHGMATTHLDALCHVLLEGKMYNGFDQSEVKSNGAERNSIMAGKDGIVSRGVLLDIPRLRGVPWLEPGESISADELSAAATSQGVEVESGDILLVATGRDARRTEHGPWSPGGVGMAGLHTDCLPWLREHDIAVLGSDGISDAMPSGIEGWPLPIHQILIPSMGVHLIDNAQLGRLSAACAEQQRWEFLLALSPLRLERGTASPINPLAIF
jgi:kynurenine formamidase